MFSFISISSLSLQNEKELLSAINYRRSLLEEAEKTCESEETRLNHLIDQRNQAQIEVNCLIKIYIQSHVKQHNIYIEKAQNICKQIKLEY